MKSKGAIIVHFTNTSLTRSLKRIIRVNRQKLIRKLAMGNFH